MHIQGNNKGIGSVRVWICLMIGAFVIYVGSKLLPMYVDYVRMKDEMDMKASMSQVLKDDEIIAALVAKARDLDLPLGPQSFVIMRDEEHHRTTISTAWDVEVHFPFDLYVRNFHFVPVSSEETKRAQK